MRYAMAAHIVEVTRANDDIAVALRDDGAFLVALLHGLRSNSIVLRCGQAMWAFAKEFPGVDAHDPHLQRGMERAAHSAQRPEPEGYIAHLLVPRQVAPNDTDEVAARFRIVAMRAHPIELRISILKTFLYGWCMRARYSESRFGHAVSGAGGRQVSKRIASSALPLRLLGIVCSPTSLATDALLGSFARPSTQRTPRGNTL